MLLVEAILGDACSTCSCGRDRRGRGAGLLVVADIVLGHMRQTLGVLLLLGAGILAIQSLGEAGRRRGGST